MNICLTGAGGFVGSYFFKAYHKQHSIKTFSCRYDSMAQLDLKYTDTVIHLAALVPGTANISEASYEKANVLKTEQLARLAKEKGVKHFIYMSTVKIYGEESETSYKENSLSCPKDAYSKSKLKAEQILLALESDTFTVSIIRAPMIYGHDVSSNMKHLITLIEKSPMLPLGGIKNRRSLVYVGNVCYLISELIQKKSGGIFLVTDEQTVSTTELVHLISLALNKKVLLFKLPFLPMLLKQIKKGYYDRLFKSLAVDDASTKKRLGLKYPYTIQEGIYYTIHGESC